MNHLQDSSSQVFKKTNMKENPKKIFLYKIFVYFYPIKKGKYSTKMLF